MQRERTSENDRINRLKGIDILGNKATTEVSKPQGDMIDLYSRKVSLTAVVSIARDRIREIDKKTYYDDK